MTPTVTAQTAAQMLTMSYDWFMRARKELEAAGFPTPLPLPSVRGQRGKSPLRWSRAAVLAWIDRPHQTAIHASVNDNDAAAPSPAAAAIRGRL